MKNYFVEVHHSAANGIGAIELLSETQSAKLSDLEGQADDMDERKSRLSQEGDWMPLWNSWCCWHGLRCSVGYVTTGGYVSLPESNALLYDL